MTSRSVALIVERYALIKNKTNVSENDNAVVFSYNGVYGCDDGSVDVYLYCDVSLVNTRMCFLTALLF